MNYSYSEVDSTNVEEYIASLRDESSLDVASYLFGVSEHESIDKQAECLVSSMHKITRKVLSSVVGDSLLKKHIDMERVVALQQALLHRSGGLAETDTRRLSRLRDLAKLVQRSPEMAAKGNCVGLDPELFFPERGASTREAKEVCRGCVVREECLEFALANGEKFGIWGGMSERERRRIRRQRRLGNLAAEKSESVSE